MQVVAVFKSAEDSYMYVFFPNYLKKKEIK